MTNDFSERFTAYLTKYAQQDGGMYGDDWVLVTRLMADGPAGKDGELLYLHDRVWGNEEVATIYNMDNGCVVALGYVVVDVVPPARAGTMLAASDMLPLLEHIMAAGEPFVTPSDGWGNGMADVTPDADATA